MTEHGDGKVRSDDQRLTWLEEEGAKIELSPLGVVMHEVASSMADGPERRTMLRIIALKQGTFEDLEDPSFQSFLVSYLRIDVSLLRFITQMVRSSVYATIVNATFDVAARGDAMSAALTSAELRDLLSRRKLVH